MPSGIWDFGCTSVPQLDQGLASKPCNSFSELIFLVSPLKALNLDELRLAGPMCSFKLKSRGRLSAHFKILRSKSLYFTGI